MKKASQSQVADTIRTGGAAKFVSVPPIEMFTNSTVTVMYMKRLDTPLAKICCPMMSAARVMAAGSVINDPNRGMKHSVAR